MSDFSYAEALATGIISGEAAQVNRSIQGQ